MTSYSSAADDDDVLARHARDIQVPRGLHGVAKRYTGI
jgi:hypothetical protein